MLVGWVLLLPTLVLACGEADRFSLEVIGEEGIPIVEAEEPEAFFQATVDLTLGVDSGGGPFEFSLVSGVAGDPDGRLIVVDQHWHEVRVFDSDGDFLYRFGGRGSGPGELMTPCCPSFGPDGLLWVNDRENGRYNAYRLKESTAEFVTTIRSATGPVVTHALAFHPDGGVIDIGGFPDGRAGCNRVIRYHLEVGGSTVRREEIPCAPQDRAPTLYGSSSSGFWARATGQTSGFVAIPAYVPHHRIAHSTTGDWAELVTSDYTVRWYGPDGALKKVIHSEVEPGPRLTSEQREFQARMIEQRGVAIPGFEPVERLQPLRDLAFDQAGRLWIQHRAREGVSRVDVWGTDGTWRAQVAWPEGVHLEGAFIQDPLAYAVEGPAHGAIRVVRIQLAPVTPGVHDG